MTENQAPGDPVALVFDMDGVLVDSAPHHARAFRSVFESKGIPNFSYSSYSGWRTLDVIEDMFRKAGQPLEREEASQLAAQKSLLAQESQLIDDPTVPGCRDTLHELSLRYRLGLASSGSRNSVDNFLARNQCAHFFRSVLSGEDVKHAKPDPEIYKLSFLALGIEPHKAIVVEDAVSGIRAAIGAGAGVVFGIAGTHPACDLRDAGAQHVLDRLTDLPAYLQSRYNDPAVAHP